MMEDDAGAVDVATQRGDALDIGQKASRRRKQETSTQTHRGIALDSVCDIVCYNIIGHYPAALLPIDLLSGARLRTLGINQEGIFRVPQPCFQRRFALAADLLDRAIDVSEICEADVANNEQSMKVLAGARVAHRLSTTEKNFTFYVAGGFVVGLILGFNPWNDIDLFTVPQWNATTRSWHLATRRSVYPVDVLVVNSPKRHIETFDLHICQCAIQCEVIDGTRHYQFMMTALCARALLMRRSSCRKHHIAVAQQYRLTKRLLKYETRRLPPVGCSHVHLNAAVQSMPQPPWDAIVQLLPCSLQKAHWTLTLNNNFISTLEFCFGDAMELTEEIKTTSCVMSEPAILYPCRYDCGYNDYAYSRDPSTHWLLRSLAGGYNFLVALPGGARVWSKIITPLWLIERHELSLSEITDAIRREWLPVTDATRREWLPNGGRYVMPCSVSAEVMVMFRNLPDNDTEYCPMWSMFLHTGGRTRLKSMMFCTESRRMCSSVCDHGCAEDVLLG